MTEGLQIQCDVFVADPIRLDLSLYKMWLNSMDEKEVTQKRLAAYPVTSQDNAQLYNLLLQDTYHQFRDYSLFEHFLRKPEHLPTQQLFQIAPPVQHYLMEKYYEFDEPILKEILGKQLKKLLSNLDDISERVKIKMHNCRRQVDNLRRVHKTVAGHPDAPVLQILQSHFLLSLELSSVYLRVLFFSKHHIEVQKKKLSFLSVSDFQQFANMIIAHWTESHGLNCNFAGLDLDQRFINEVRDIKTLLTSDKDTLVKYMALIKAKFLEAGRMDSERFSKLEGKIHLVIKDLLKLSAGISNPKEFKSIFIDMLEKVAEPFKRTGLSQREVEDLFVFMGATFGPLVGTITARHRERLEKTWSRFLQGFQQCLSLMYQQMGDK